MIGCGYGKLIRFALLVEIDERCIVAVLQMAVDGSARFDGPIVAVVVFVHVGEIGHAQIVNDVAAADD